MIAARVRMNQFIRDRRPSVAVRVQSRSSSAPLLQFATRAGPALLARQSGNEQRSCIE